MESVNLNKYYEELNNYIDISLSKEAKNFGLIVEGEAGFGKTTQIVTQILKRKIPSKYIKSYTTPLSLYKTLYENKDKIVILDDCDSLFSNRTALAILKGALDDSIAGRVVQWNSTTPLLNSMGIEPEFTFKGRIIIIVNEISSKNNDIKAIKSRCFYSKIMFNLTKKLEMIQLLSNNREKKKVYNLLLKEATKYHKFDFRTFNKLVGIYTSKGLKALRLSLNNLLEEDTSLIAFDKATENKSLTVSAQVRLFRDLSGLSRASFFRIKRKVSKSHE